MKLNRTPVDLIQGLHQLGQTLAFARDSVKEGEAEILPTFSIPWT